MRANAARPVFATATARDEWTRLAGRGPYRPPAARATRAEPKWSFPQGDEGQ